MPIECSKQLFSWPSQPLIHPTSNMALMLLLPHGHPGHIICGLTVRARSNEGHLPCSDIIIYLKSVPVGGLASHLSLVADLFMVQCRVVHHSDHTLTREEVGASQ